MIERHEVERAIENAFASLDAPPRESIGYDSTGYDLESNAVRDFFWGKTWSQVTLIGLRRDYPGDASACLGFMTNEAFRYYLPAYLVMCIKEGLEDLDSCLSSTIDCLTLPTSEDRGQVREFLRTAPLFCYSEIRLPHLKGETQRFLQKMSGFSTCQERAIAMFLRFMREMYPADLGRKIDAAMERYWNMRIAEGGV
jgi:hypothetical protein